MEFGILHFIRLSLVHLVYLFYPGYTWYLCITNVDAAGYSQVVAKTLCGAWFIVHGFTQLVLFVKGIKEKPIMTRSWFLVYMFCFTFLSMPPYMFTLEMLYKISETRLNQKVGKLANSTSLIHISIEEGDNVVFQVAMVILLLTYIVYPLPRRPYDIGAYLALAIEFMNAFDIMDMLGDIVFIRTYGLGWRFVYYASMGVSVLLLSFPINIEEDFMDFPSYFFNLVSHWMGSREEKRQNAVTNVNTNHGFDMVVEDAKTSVECVCVVNDGGRNEADIRRMGSDANQYGTDRLGARQERELNSLRVVNVSTEGNTIKGSLDQKVARQRLVSDAWKRVLKTMVTIIFTDVMFATIRIEIMVRERLVDHGFNMVTKNLILALLHSLYLLKHLKALKVLYVS